MTEPDVICSRAMIIHTGFQKRNDEERLRVYKEAGEDGLREYLGTKKEIDFDRINEVLAAFHEGKDSITLRHMGREDGEISLEETDFFRNIRITSGVDTRRQ